MNTYKSMSDFEINKLVANKLGLFVVAVAQDGIIVSGKSLSIDYCNNPSDAWPIVVENKIGIKHFNRGSWQAHCQGDEVVHDENPLRAAMTVYLMMGDNS